MSLRTARGRVNILNGKVCHCEEQSDVTVSLTCYCEEQSDVTVSLTCHCEEQSDVAIS
jgi:hypothetical protein